VEGGGLILVRAEKPVRRAGTHPPVRLSVRPSCGKGRHLPLLVAALLSRSVRRDAVGLPCDGSGDAYQGRPIRRTSMFGPLFLFPGLRGSRNTRKKRSFALVANSIRETVLKR